MDLPQRLSFVVQPNRLQGLIWQALLKSQKMSVILENANGELSDCLDQIASAGLTLPDIIILDAETPGLNPFEFCRWCRERFPKIKVFLTRVHPQPLSDTERRWAMKQGAASFLNGFDRETLMSTATGNLKEILSVIDEPFLDERALLTVLLNVRRQISSTKSAGGSVKSAAQTDKRAEASSPVPEQRVASHNRSEPVNGLNDLDWVAAGLKALNRRKFQTEAPSAKTSTSASLDPVEASTQPPKVNESDAPVRRYRGVAY